MWCYGPEFVARDLRKWLANTGAKTPYIEPGSPWENGYCESFNSKLRDEFLNGEIFYSIKEIRILAERWRVHYNTIRPHSSLGYRPPAPESWQTIIGQRLTRAGRGILSRRIAFLADNQSSGNARPHIVLQNSNSPGLMRAARLMSIVGALYCLADFALNRYALGDGWTILWPLNGITIGLLLMRRRSDWPAILAGTFIGLGVGEYFDDNPLYVVIAQRIFSAAEVLLCALILPEFKTLESWLRSPRLSLRLYSALLLGPGLSGLAAAVFARYVQHESFLIALNDWATADALGIVATLPVVLSLGTSEMRGLFEPRRLPMTIGTLSLCFGVVVLIFSVSPYPIEFLLFPVLMLADVLLTFAGASLAALGVCLLAVYLTIHHPGPLIRPYLHSAVERDLILQIYLSFHLFALFPASIVFLERRWMMRQIGDANIQLTRLAATDGLTGIANRRAFEEGFASEWRVATRSRKPIGLLMIDLDCFKQFNDEYGHLAGDICLQRVAEALLTVARRPHDMAARYGGEEFAVLLPDTSSEVVLSLADSLRVAVYEQAIEHKGSPWERVTVSIGCVSAIPEYGRPMTELLDLADKSLYRAKHAGRNTVCRASLDATAAEDATTVA